MKKIFILALSLFLIGLAKPAFPQAGSITIGLIATECDQIIIQWTSTYSFVGLGSNKWTQSTITLEWPTSMGTASTLGAITSIAPGMTGWTYDAPATIVGSNYHRVIILPNSAYTQDIPIGTTEIISIKLGGTGSGDFTLVNPLTDISSFNFAGQMWSGTFNPTSVTGVPYADAIRWNGTRWCGGSSTTYAGEPSTADNLVNCFITGANGVLHEANAQVANLTVDAAC